jgi:hypothetical protein
MNIYLDMLNLDVKIYATHRHARRFVDLVRSSAGYHTPWRRLTEVTDGDPLTNDQPPNVTKYPDLSQNVISTTCGKDRNRWDFVSGASAGASASGRRSLTY